MPSQSIGPLLPPAAALSGNPADQLRLNARSGEGYGRTDVKSVSQEFEALFVTYLLKVMRETIEEANKEEGGSGKGIYTDLFDQEFARGIARQKGLGISDLLVRNLRLDAPESGEGGHGKTGTGIGPAPQRAIPPETGRPVSSLELESSDVPDFRLPVQAPVSSVYGMRRDPFTRLPRFHKGLDLAAPAGTDVRSALGGEVISAGFEPGYGNTVVLQHPGGLQTRYAHLGVTGVKKGDIVAPEQVLGIVGNTGHSTGPHLHFEVIRWGENINPLGAAADGSATFKAVKPLHLAEGD